MAATGRLAIGFLIMVILLPQAARAQYVQMEEGRQRFIVLGEPIAELAVSNPQVVFADLSETGEVRVLGLSPGRADVTIWLDDQERTRVNYVVTVTPSVFDFQRFLANDPEFAGVSVETSGDRVMLSGVLPNRQSREVLQRIATGFFGENVIDLTEVGSGTMVAVEVRFYALNTSTVDRLGLNLTVFGDTFQSALNPPGTTGGYTFEDTGLVLEASLPFDQAFNLFLSSADNAILAVLSALSSANLAQALAEPTLLVRDGGTASFLAGGEVPIPISDGEGGITIEYREFGIRLDLAADIMSRDRIIMQVSPEISELDFSNSVTVGGTSVPGLRRRSTSTTIELGDGQSFVLAGLMYTATTDIDERMPIIGDIPIIGTLFRRTETQQEAQELIVVATPRLVQPLEPGQAPELPVPSAIQPSAEDWLIGRNPIRDSIAEHGLIR